MKERPDWAIFLYNLRNRESLTQQQFGELVKIKQGDLSKMENGNRPIGKEVAKRIGKAFNVDYRQFL